MSGPTDWGSWVSFGFPSVGLADYERMAVAQNQDGHLEVFVVGSDGAVWHRWQTAPNGNWSEWAPFGQPNGVSFAVNSVPPIQVEQNADGRVEVFLLGSDDNVWHIWQTAQNNGWSGWGNLGRPNSIPIGGSSLVRNQGGELEIFVENNNTGELWSIRQVDPNGKRGWVANWTSLGSPSPGIRSFSAVVNANKQLEVLAIGGAGAIWHNVRGGFPPAWRGWSVVVGAPSGVSLSVFEAVRPNQDGRRELVCLDSNNNYWHTWQSSPRPDQWSGFWDNFGQPPGGTRQGFDMRLDSNGLLEGLTWGNDFRTYQISQSAPNNGWTGWSVLSSDITVFKAPLMVMSQNQNGHWRLSPMARTVYGTSHKSGKKSKVRYLNHGSVSLTG